MVIYKKFRKYLIPLLFFLGLAIILILVWFKDGHFYGGADVGLPTYNPIRIFQMARYIWWEAIAPGFLIPHTITSITFYFLLSMLQLLNIGPVLIQAIVYGAILFFMGFGMYLLSISIIGQDKRLYAVIAGLFYIFNPYMMTQIWHRFVHTSFLFVSALPYLLLLWRLWIKNGNYLNLLFFLLVNVLASYMFGTIAFVAPLWLILSLFTIAETLFPWNDKSHLIMVIRRFTIGLIFWILFNSWWLMPVLTVSQGVATQQHNVWESISTLQAISKQAILPYSLPMGNSYYLFDQAELGEIYRGFFFRFIPWIGVGVIFYGIIFSLKKRQLSGLVLIYLVIIMFSKGVSSPFGQPFLILFSKSFILGLLRNPFEKIGILLPVIGSILFIVGLEELIKLCSKSLGKTAGKIILISLITCMGIYYWPMYQGKVFGRIDQPNYVEIPSSYLQADEWLKERVSQVKSGSDGRILHLPLTRSDVVTYNWQFGYHGIESSSSIFTALPSISRGIALKNTDDALTALSLVFLNPYDLHQDKVLKLLEDFSVRFIVLHKDIVWKGADVYDPNETEKVLDGLNFLERKVHYGDLIIYELLPKYFKSKVVLANNINFAGPNETKMKIWPFMVFEKSYNIITPTNDYEREIIERSGEKIFFPKLSFSYMEASGSGMDYVANQLIRNNSNLQTNKFYIEKDNDIDSKELINSLMNASESLVNIYVIAKNNYLPQVDAYLKAYQEKMSNLLAQDLRNSKLSFYVSSATVDNIFKLHLLILEHLESRLNQEQKGILQPLKNKIKQDLIRLKLVPNYLLADRGDLTVSERQINQFQITQKGEYELLMAYPQSRDIYHNRLDKLDFQINDKIVSLQANKKGDLTSFGVISLNEGMQEITFERLVSENQFSLNDLEKIGNVKILDQNTIQLSSDGIQPAYVDRQLTKVEGEESYLVTFDAFIQSGIGFYIQIIQDTDPLQREKSVSAVRVSVYRTSQESSWKSYRVQLLPLNLTSRKATLRLIVDPTGTTSFGDLISSQPTVVSIKNVQVGRILDNPIFLYSKSQLPDAPFSSEVTQFKKATPVLYTGKLRTDKPTFMIFKEAFYPGWELELIRDNKVYKVEKHYLANLYSNSWWIEEGEYDFRIEFKPQRKVNLGYFLGAGGLIVLLTLLAGSKFKQKYGRK